MAIGRKKRQSPTTTSMGYYCQCPPIYTGARCQSYITLCASNPCQNNGTCYQDPILNIIHCLCTPNYTGILCNTTINGSNVCIANPSVCFNGGTCRVNPTSSQGFSCVCTATTTGLFCEQPLTDCQINASACFNNGTCVSLSVVVFICIE